MLIGEKKGSKSIVKLKRTLRLTILGPYAEECCPQVRIIITGLDHHYQTRSCVYFRQAARTRRVFAIPAKRNGLMKEIRVKRVGGGQPLRASIGEIRFVT